MTREMEFVSREYGVAKEELERFFQNAAEVSFADEQVKHRLYSLKFG